MTTAPIRAKRTLSYCSSKLEERFRANQPVFYPTASWPVSQNGYFVHTNTSSIGVEYFAGHASRILHEVFGNGLLNSQFNLKRDVRLKEERVNVENFKIDHKPFDVNCVLLTLFKVFLF